MKGTIKPEWQVTPPLLTVIAPTVAMGDTVHIKGSATDDRLVRDVYVRVWNRNAKIPVKKAFYQPNRMVGDRTKMDFEADIPLWAGSNLVQVFARESNEVQSLQTIVVLKRASGSNLVRAADRGAAGVVGRRHAAVPGREAAARRRKSSARATKLTAAAHREMWVRAYIASSTELRGCNVRVAHDAFATASRRCWRWSRRAG